MNKLHDVCKKSLYLILCYLIGTCAFAHYEDSVRDCVQYFKGLSGWTGNDYSASIHACYQKYADYETSEKIRDCVQYYEGLSGWTGRDYSADIDACYDIR